MTDQDQRRSSPFVGTHAHGAADQARSSGSTAGAVAPLLGQSEPDQLGFDELLPLAIPDGQRRGAGRPRGAANIRTNTTFQAAVSRYGDPLIATVAFGNMPTRDLITELRKIASDCGLKLGASVMDVVRFQEECRRNALPYGHAKRAATDEKGDTVVPIIGIGSVNVAVAAGGRSIEDVLDAEAKTIEHQGDSDATGK